MNPQEMDILADKIADSMSASIDRLIRTFSGNSTLLGKNTEKSGNIGDKKEAETLDKISTYLELLTKNNKTGKDSSELKEISDELKKIASKHSSSSRIGGGGDTSSILKSGKYLSDMVGKAEILPKIFNSLMAPISAVGAAFGKSLNLQNAISATENYNQSLLTLSSTFTKFGYGILQAQGSLSELRNETGLTYGETDRLINQYASGFNFTSLRAASSLMMNLRNAVGSNAEAMQQMESVLSEISQKFPDLERSVTRLNSSDKSLLTLQNIGLVATGGINIQQSRQLESYINQGQQGTPADAAQQTKIKGQVSNYKTVSQFFESTELSMGKSMQGLIGATAKEMKAMHNEIPVLAKSEVAMQLLSISITSLSGLISGLAGSMWLGVEAFKVMGKGVSFLNSKLFGFGTDLTITSDATLNLARSEDIAAESGKSGGFNLKDIKNLNFKEKPVEGDVENGLADINAEKQGLNVAEDASKIGNLGAAADESAGLLSKAGPALGDAFGMVSSAIGPLIASIGGAVGSYHLASAGFNYFVGKPKTKGEKEAKTGVDDLAAVGGGAAAGAIAGSVVPVIGTAVGALIGATAGVGVALYENAENGWKKNTAAALKGATSAEKTAKHFSNVEKSAASTEKIQEQTMANLRQQLHQLQIGGKGHSKAASDIKSTLSKDASKSQQNRFLEGQVMQAKTIAQNLAIAQKHVADMNTGFFHHIGGALAGIIGERGKFTGENQVKSLQAQLAMQKGVINSVGQQDNKKLLKMENGLQRGGGKENLNDVSFVEMEKAFSKGNGMSLITQAHNREEEERRKTAIGNTASGVKFNKDEEEVLFNKGKNGKFNTHLINNTTASRDILESRSKNYGAKISMAQAYETAHPESATFVNKEISTYQKKQDSINLLLKNMRSVGAAAGARYTAFSTAMATISVQDGQKIKATTDLLDAQKGELSANISLMQNTGNISMGQLNKGLEKVFFTTRKAFEAQKILEENIIASKKAAEKLAAANIAKDKKTIKEQGPNSAAGQAAEKDLSTQKATGAQAAMSVRAGIDKIKQQMASLVPAAIQTAIALSDVFNSKIANISARMSLAVSSAKILDLGNGNSSQMYAAHMAQQAAASSLVSAETQKLNSLLSHKKELEQEIAKDDASGGNSKNQVKANHQILTYETAIYQQRQKINEALAQAVQATQQLETINEGMINLTSSQVGEAEARVGLANSLGFGAQASVHLRMQLNQSFSQEVAQMEVRKKAADQHYRELVAQKAPQAEIIAALTIRKKIETHILGIQQQQQQNLKSLRDNYLSAIASVDTATGIITKVITTQTKNFGSAAQNTKGMIQSLTTGGVSKDGYQAGWNYAGSATQNLASPGNINMTGAMHTRDPIKITSGESSGAANAVLQLRKAIMHHNVQAERHWMAVLSSSVNPAAGNEMADAGGVGLYAQSGIHNNLPNKQQVQKKPPATSYLNKGWVAHNQAAAAAAYHAGTPVVKEGMTALEKNTEAINKNTKALTSHFVSPAIAGHASLTAHTTAVAHAAVVAHAAAVTHAAVAKKQIEQDKKNIPETKSIIANHVENINKKSESVTAKHIDKIMSPLHPTNFLFNKNSSISKRWGLNESDKKMYEKQHDDINDNLYAKRWKLENESTENEFRYGKYGKKGLSNDSRIGSETSYSNYKPAMSVNSNVGVSVDLGDLGKLSDMVANVVKKEFSSHLSEVAKNISGLGATHAAYGARFT